MCPAAAAAESMNGYIAIDEADILGAGEEKADEPVIDDDGCKDALKDDILLWCCCCEKFALVPVDKFEFVDDKDELEAMDGDGEQPVDPELAFQHIIIW